MMPLVRSRSVKEPLASRVLFPLTERRFTYAEYERFLEEFAADENAWCALPHEVSAWWRRRAASRVVPGAAGWTVEGPAAREARIKLGAPV